MENELNACFQQKFATGSYGVGIGRAWCSRKACEICSSLVQKKKLKNFYFSSHKLPKQQSTIFWSQGILGLIEHPQVQNAPPPIGCLKMLLNCHWLLLKPSIGTVTVTASQWLLQSLF
jgi:hypothetical protein